ncbi:hypothetical protein SSBR45G_68020 [Bradyrhizobium sp. SSBR45G]|uniref:DUF3429 domain-containing protein n=1 Tax=unclassified Bradyrhizobium TaxID=2631580 RepID=UPI0023429CE5|nr:MULTISPECIES: DUF3429 domain-containing protein [unclassified Bradyrhizobium]GLH81893.1 hypothetical protein SSBR45G_68020 [Bradyrhizobium sp. SSBR45G]GLH89372.1 hypothetical protein SSBR45R_68330 [Bradyrhizobium sp. SSBR45R]
MLAGIPTSMRILGLAGLIPFVGFALLVIAGQGPVRLMAVQAQIAYGAVILSFLGAVHWGLAVQAPALAGWWRMAWGVTPALLGWAALLLPAAASLVLLAAALLAALIVDELCFGGGDGRSWFLKLRRLLSVGAMAAMLATFIAIIVGGTAGTA